MNIKRKSIKKNIFLVIVVVFFLITIVFFVSLTQAVENNLVIEKNQTSTPSSGNWNNITIKPGGVLRLINGDYVVENKVDVNGGKVILENATLTIKNNLNGINGARIELIDDSILEIGKNITLANATEMKFIENIHYNETGRIIYPRVIVGNDFNLNQGALITANATGYKTGDLKCLIGCGQIPTEGGSYGGIGQNVTDQTRIYGSSFIPLDFGSAGGGVNGGAGGGIIDISVDGEFDLAGLITATGGFGTYDSSNGAGSGGSGGSIFINANSIDFGQLAAVVARGGEGISGSGYGGGGRIAVYYNEFKMPISTFDLRDGFEVSGGLNLLGNYDYFGTIVLINKNNKDISDIKNDFCGSSPNIDLKLVDSYHLRSGDPACVNLEDIQFRKIYLDGVHVDYQGDPFVEKITLNSSNSFGMKDSEIIFPREVDLRVYSPEIQILDSSNIWANTYIQSGILSIDGTSSIDASGQGQDPFPAAKPIIDVATGLYGGGGYGGNGGGYGNSYGQKYGNEYLFTHPNMFKIYPGTAGASPDNSWGGGVISIKAESRFELYGILKSNGVTGQSGGSGGSIYLNVKELKVANDNQTHFEANGGNSSGNGAGSGGRVAIYFSQLLSSELLNYSSNKLITANRGVDSKNQYHGDPGTIYIVSPWIETKNGDIYSGGQILKAGVIAQPPPSKYNLSYLYWAKGQVGSEFISEKGVGNSLYAYENSADLVFPRGGSQGNNYTSLVGKINRAYLEKNTTSQFSNISAINDQSLAGKIYSYIGEGDLLVNVPQLYFTQPNGNNSGAGTIILGGKNLKIQGDIYYVDNSALDKIKNIPSVAWMVFKDSNGNGGNIYIDGSVTEISGILYAEGEIHTGDGGVSGNCLTVNGSLIASRIYFERTCRDKERGSEQIINDGRMTVNPPPGLENLIESMPVWRESNLN